MAKIINLINKTVRLFPLDYAGRCVRQAGDRFFDLATGQEIPYVMFPPAPRPRDGYPVSVAELIEMAPVPVRLGNREIHIPLWTISFQVYPASWLEDPEAAYGIEDGDKDVFYIVPTAVLTVAAQLFPGHRFIAPLSGRWRVYNERHETVGTTGFAHRIVNLEKAK